MNDVEHTGLPVERLRSMAEAYRISQAIYVAARLNIADELADGARHVNDLARATGVDCDALGRLLSALASVDVFSLTETGAFQLTAISQHLRTDSPESIHPWVIAMTELPWQPWGRLIECVQSGNSSFESVFGMSRYEYLQHHPQQARCFDRAMATYRGRFRLSDAYDFSSCRTVVDLGGGTGDCLADILEAFPNVSGVLLERADVLDEARTHLLGRGLAGRCEFLSGDFFEEVPRDGDVYILKSVLHNWNDARALDLLSLCHESMRDGSRLLVVEPAPDQPGDNARQAFQDLHMLVMHGGRERSKAEMATLLSTAGFKVLGSTPHAHVRVTEAVRPAA